MNHIYRLCWNRASEQWVPASELATRAAPVQVSRKRTVGRRALMLSVLTASLCAAGVAYAGNGPMGGQIMSGSGQIQQVGNTTTIRQDSSTLTLNWQSFNIASNQTVDFLQPGSSAIAVNRIFSSTPSEIYGHLNANGQVWLINPNGILFGQSAQVNVGGLVASTLDLDDSTLLSDSRHFSGSGKGSVINKGTITAANGGYVALLANQVSNQGVVTAQLGTVALGGGSAVTLTFSGDKLLHVQVDQSTLNNLAENRQLIVANGGQVIMTAGAKDALLASVVNNTGVVQAQTVQNHNGTITLLGGMEAGTVNVGGTLDASAPNGGNGGSIETSAANFNLASTARITAASPHGTPGTWLVDPTDLTIDGPSATTISNTLNGGTNVTETTTATAASGVGVQSSGLGDINVDAPISWGSTATLTLQAYNAIYVNAPVTGSGRVLMQSGVGQTGATAANISIGSFTGPGQTYVGSIIGNAGVTLASANNFINGEGSTAVSTGTSNPWLIYSTSPTLNTSGGLTPNFIQYNAPYQTAALGAGNGFLYSLAPTVTITGLTGSVTKTYDGTTSASLTSANFTTSGLVNGDQIASGSATGTYASANAGTNISVTSSASGANFTFTDATGAIAVYGYRLAGTASAAIGTINPKQLTASIIGNPTKIYDGTTTATLSSSNYQLAGFVSGQGATVNQPSSVGYASANAGPETINAVFSAPNFTANSGTVLSNYILPTSGSGAGTITPAPLLIRGLLTTNKVYDGTKVDSLVTSGVSLYGVIASDTGDVTLDSTSAAGAFASSNVGNNLAVTLSGFVLDGSKASNYSLIVPTTLTANITPKALTISDVVANDKVYNATTADTLDLANVQLSGIVGNDNVTLSTARATAVFSQSNVGNNLAVTASGFSLLGTAAGNYTVSQPSGLTADITPAPLTITMIGNPTKIYDGTDAATLTNANFSITGFVTGQKATLPQTSSATYATSNAGTGITVTADIQASDFDPAANTSLSNYSFPLSVTGTGAITPAPLTGTIIGNPTKVYDGTNVATLTASNFQLTGFVGGESISATPPGTVSGTYGSANAGVQSVTATLGAADFTAASGTLLSNYSFPADFTGFGTITQKAVGVSLSASINPQTKVYDGTVTAKIQGTDFVLSGFVGTDSATVTGINDVGYVNGSYASANVGNQPVSASLVKGDFTFTSGNANNYTFPVAAYGTGTITPAQLFVAISNTPTKVYDGTTAALLASNNFSITGWVKGQGGKINPTASFTYASANASTVGGDTVSGSLTSNNYVPQNGTLMSNYTIATSASGAGTITQAPLYITGVYATSKVYDTTETDALNVSKAALAGLVSTDKGLVALTDATTGTFATANAGTGIAVTPGLFTISGTQASNYALVQPTGLTANITPAPVTISGVSATSRTYNGSVVDTLNSSGASISGVYNSDSGNVALSSTAATGQFSSANVGNNLAVTTSGFSLTGTQAGNYQVVQPSGLTANITPAVLTASITGDPTKAYDGSTSATLTAVDYTLTGLAPGQSISIPQSATAAYASPNAGSETVQSTLVTSDFIARAGTNLSNYVLPTGATGIGKITPKILNLSASRLYNGSVDALGSLFGTLTGLNGDKLTVSGEGLAATKDVGTYTGTGSGVTLFTLNTLTLVGAGTANASNYTLVGGTDTFKITPIVINLSGTREYDQNTDALGSLFGTLNGITGESLTVTGSGTTSNKNVGTYKRSSNTLALNTLTLVGNGSTDANDYTLTGGTDTFTITKLPITITTLAQNKVYDGTNAATVAYTGNGIFIGDTVNFNGASTFSQSNVGNNLTVTSKNITATGADAGNYSFVNTATTTANITPKLITLISSRIYDGTANANASLFTTGGKIATGVGTQTLTLTGVGVLDSKNAGAEGFQNLGTLALSNSSGLASNYTLSFNGAGNPPAADVVTISPYVLNLTGTRVYDANTDANGNLFGTLMGLSGDTLTVNGSGVTGSKNVGTYSNTTPGSTFGLGTLSLAGNGSAVASNYTLVGGTDTFSITPLAILVSLSASNKAYDGTTNATAILSSAGVLGSDQVTFASNPAMFASPNAANGITVTAASITDGGADAHNYTLINASASTTANITPALITLTSSRTYDGTTNADASLFTTGGTLATGIGGQTLTLSGVGALNGKDAGTQGFQSLGSLTLGDATGSASNYTLSLNGAIPPAGDSVMINPAILNLSGTRFYDGNTDANGNLFGTLTGFGGDTFTVSGSGVTGGKNVAAYSNSTPGATFGLGTLALVANGSANASDYTLVGGMDTFAITPLPLVLTSARVYNATTSADASLFTTGGTIVGVGGETLALTGSGVLTTKNVGSQQPFQSLGTLALGNGTGQASNYTLSPISSDWVTITPLSITVDATGSNKIYDGATTATVGLGTNGILPGDHVSFADGSANFSSPNAANGITINVSGITDSGADAGNYVFNTTAITTANITPVVINLSGARVYDGATDANADLFGNGGVVAGINGQTLNLTGSGVLISKNVSPAQGFASLGSLTLNDGSGLASNYTLVGGVDQVAITPAILTVTGTLTTNRTYDGTMIDALSGSTLAGVFGSDNVNLGNDTIGLFGDKNVGNNKSVSTAMTISGGDASNYILEQPTGLVANITPLPITIAATGTNRMYNGKVGDVVKLDSNGVLAGDQLSFTSVTSNFNNPYVGNNKPVTVTGIAANGADAGNYLILDPTTTTQANITNVGFMGSGVQGNWIAQLQYDMEPRPIATPYGSADMDTVGVFTGNQKLKHRPIERNRTRSDFRSGLQLQSQNGGVQLPTDASP